MTSKILNGLLISLMVGTYATAAGTLAMIVANQNALFV